MTDQISFGAAEFAANPEPRCSCLLLLDVSGSMAGPRLAELNKGLAAFKEALCGDSLALKRVEVGIVSFGPVQVTQAFEGAETFYPPLLTAQGDTPMGAAILTGLDLVRQRKAEYKANAVRYFRPWILLITDGAPTDDWKAAAEAVREGESAKSFAFFAVGVAGADMSTLRQISVREPLGLDGLKFREMFLWLSSSLGNVSRSTPGAEVKLEPPTGWAAI